MKSLRHSRRASGGFSLIEVTIALGITAFGITSVLGLLPQSLDQIRKASDVGAEARIFQQIASDISQAEWDSSSSSAAPASTTQTRRYYFDRMAQALTEHDAALELAYIAEVRVEPAGVVMPGGEFDSNLRRVFIRLLQTGVADADLDLSAGDALKSYSTLIARIGR